MRLFCLFISLVIFSNVHSETTKDIKDTSMSVIKNSPFASYSSEFVFKNGDNNLGKVIRTGLCCPRYYYDLYNANNTFELRGITRFLSLGFFDPFLIDIDIYDNHSSYVGSIEGKIITRSRAKFSFVDVIGNVKAICYLDAKKFDFLIVSPQDELKIIAKIEGNTYGDVGLIDLKFLSNETNMNLGFLKIFAAFISDYQESFLPPPEEIHHYHESNHYHYYDWDNR